MEFTEVVFYHNPLRAWIIAAGIILVVFTLLRIMVGIFRRRLAPLAARTRTVLDDAFLCMLQNTKSFALLLLAAYLARQVLMLPEGMGKGFSIFVILGSLVQVGIWGTCLIVFFVQGYAQDRREVDPSSSTTVSALGFVARLLLWTVLLLLGLDNLGVDVTALIAGLGLTGIAVALALQNVLGDLFASLSIVLDKPFIVGDSITVGEFNGTVEQVGLKTTRVRSLSGEEIIFGNEDLLKSRIRNYKRMVERRVAFSIGVVYGTPAEKLAAIPDLIRGLIENDARARFDRCHFKTYGDFALIFETVYYVLSPDYAAYMDVRQDINLAIYGVFEKQGIEFAHPTQTIHLRTSGKPPG